MRSLLLIAHAFPPENTIGAQRPYRFAKYLPGSGYKPLIVTASPQPAPQTEDLLVVPHRPSYPVRLINGYVWPNDERLTWVRPAVQAIREWRKDRQVHGILSTSPPFSGHMVARRLKREWGVPWIADFRDPMRGNAGHGRYYFSVADGYFEPQFFHYADCLIANTDATRDLWLRSYPQYESKMRVIYNGYDPEAPGLEPAPLRPRSARVMTHAGSLYRVSLRELFFDRFAELALQDRFHPQARLRFVGDMEHEAELRRRPSVARLEEGGLLEITPRAVPLDAARRMMAESDFLLVIDYLRTSGILVQLPAKVFDYVQIGRPILAVTWQDSPLAHVLQTSGLPHAIVSPDQTADRQREVIRGFLGLPSDPTPLSRAFVDQFSAPSQARALAAMLDQIIGPR